MKRWSVLYLTLAAALLTGLAHLRADWLGGSPERTASAPDVPPVVWAAGRVEPRLGWLFLRQR